MDVEARLRITRTSGPPQEPLAVRDVLAAHLASSDPEHPARLLVRTPGLPNTWYDVEVVALHPVREPVDVGRAWAEHVGMDLPQPHDGATFDPERDEVRLNVQTQAVYDAMRDGRWYTLADIAARTRAPEASVSARIRDLRKPRFGGHTIERRHRSGGQWKYRMIGQERVGE